MSARASSTSRLGPPRKQLPTTRSRRSPSAGPDLSMAQGGASGDIDRGHQRLQARVREQEGVIRKLWERYTEDVGREPELGGLFAGPGDRLVPVKAEILRHALAHDQSFADAVEEFEFHFTYGRSEATVQRSANRLMHGRRPAVVNRRAGDVVLKGFWGRGVSMPAFERLQQKLHALQHGSIRRIDLSDNGLNGNFVPGLIDMLRRGARQLDISQNSLESPAAQQLCNAIPQVAQYLESLDLRLNPCASDSAFALSLSLALPELRFLESLAVTLRSAEPTSERSYDDGFASDNGYGGRRGVSAPKPRPASSGRAQQSSLHPSQLDPDSWRARSLSRSRVDGTSAARSSSPPAGRGSGTALDGITGRLTGTQLGDSGSRDAAVLVFRSVGQCPQLRSLDLRGSCLSRAAAQRLAHFVKGDQLVTLSLADCFLGAKAEPVLGAVSQCRKMVYLNLRLNGLNGNTGIELCRALDASVSLTDVDLASNELGDDFGTAFATVLMVNEVLWRVDLIRNPLGERTGDALLRALRERNSTLSSIGDTVDNLFGLGLQNRYQIQRHLDANSRGLEPGCSVRTTHLDLDASYRPSLGDEMEPGLADFEWQILDDDPSVNWAPLDFEMFP
eukprot:gnl/TRDRNA2_/TRDRNA2_131417_c0_seq2.p1 gnl/TRDRNA2_/TRDRNA2_131417_c0~~gnl/TRDRNA2_/TRDRNA2_131417_c0_seq2.p1  ORF type:complete len:619 (-),score=103.49 gnl/TRDRNA2_/TRDRNA2_131417_c0_seq2:223-2079(-)